MVSQLNINAIKYAMHILCKGLQNNHIENTVLVLTFPSLPLPYPTRSHRVHPPSRVSSSGVYSQCAVYVVVGPCSKGHLIHGGTNGPGVPLLLLLLGHIEGDIMQNHDKNIKSEKKVKNQDSMDKRNFFLNTLRFSPWAILATWLLVGAPRNIQEK
jgi:hypothetical protein